jgi:lipoprotein-anchoring transpeptidase ErfK/SrfK
MPPSTPRPSRQQRRAKKAARRKAVFGGVAVVVLVTALVGGYVALAGGSDSERPQVTEQRASNDTTSESTPPSTLAEGQSLIAEAKDEVTKIEVFDEPDAPSPRTTYENPWLLNGEADKPIQQVYLIERYSPDNQWLHVILPERPNNTTGWVRASDFTVVNNAYNILVNLGEHKIIVRDGKNVIYEGPVAIGSEEPLPDSGGKPTPTPTGIYYIRVLLENTDPSSVYGPYAYGLSAHSETLESFSGGDAEIGIHGNNDASVLGQSVTHGCIRMDNDKISELSKILPLGTPVIIQ